MGLTVKEAETLTRLAAKASGKVMRLTIAEMAEAFAGEAIDQLQKLTKGAPQPEVRLKASTALLEIAAKAEADRSDYFQGSPEALHALSLVPIEQQRSAALQMFANGEISRRDLDTVLKVIDSDNKAKIEALLAHNAQLTEQLIDAANANRRTIPHDPYGNESPLDGFNLPMPQGAAPDETAPIDSETAP